LYIWAVKKTSLIAAIAFVASNLTAQITNKPGSQYQFEEITAINKTEIKDQCRTGTCWSYSTLSFLESELIREGKGDHDLSEMFVARNAYLEKAITYLRMNGKHQFDEGGEGHDIPFIIEKYGIVPEEVYTGLLHGKKRHNHAQLVSVLSSMVGSLKSTKEGELGPEWKDAINGVLDAYLGAIPESFEYRGKTYTPKSFAASLELDMDDYAVVTSFTHHPFYKPFAIEVPDNWAMQTALNVTLDEMMEVIQYSLKKGYSVAWATDVSEKGFSFRNALAIVPQHDSMIREKGKDNRLFNNAGSEKVGNAFNQPYPEKTITQELRQASFDNQTTTDDHGMHIVGMYKESKTSTPFYHVKNSWGTKNPAKGYLFASDSYLRYKTICVMVNKKGIPKSIQKKLGL